MICVYADFHSACALKGQWRKRYKASLHTATNDFAQRRKEWFKPGGEN